jgi:hypothetical protein
VDGIVTCGVVSLADYGVRDGTKKEQVMKETKETEEIK